MVGFPGGDVFIDLVLGYQKQGDALGASRGTFNARQHGMNNVVHHILIPAGDKYFIAGDGKGAILISHSRCTQFKGDLPGFPPLVRFK